MVSLVKKTPWDGYLSLNPESPHDILFCIVPVADDHTAPAAGQAETLRRKTFFRSPAVIVRNATGR